MTTKYGKILLQALFSQNSDFSLPDINTQPVVASLTPELYLHDRMALSTTALALDLSRFATISAMVFINRSATAGETIRVAYSTTTKVLTPTTVTFVAASSTTFGTIQALDGTNLFAMGATPGKLIYVTGSGEAGNNTVWEVVKNSTTSSTYDTVSVQAPSYAAVSGPSAGVAEIGVTMTIVSAHVSVLAINNGFLVVSQDLAAAALSGALRTLYLTADSGAPELEIVVMGT
jgi:hypothetical protein